MAAGRLKLLFDENVSARQVEFVAKEAKLAECNHVLKLGWSGEEDAVWIPRAVEAGFCIVTGDRNDRTRRYTVADLKSMRARVLLLGAFFDHLDRWQRAKWLVAKHESLVSIANTLTPGSVVLVGRNGRGNTL